MKIIRTIIAIVISLVLMFTFTYMISTAVFVIIKQIPMLADSNFLLLWLIISTLVFSIISSYYYAFNLLPKKQTINLGPIHFDNPFYDPVTEVMKDEEVYYKKYNNLIKKYNDLEKANSELIDELLLKDNELQEEYYFTQIFIRHHINSSRLVRSLTQLINEGNENWKYEFINNVLDECGTVLMNNDADKSSSVYFINAQNELEMYAYNRIEFSSSRNRRFKKGEGFAGRIWDLNDSLLVNDTEDSQYFKQDYTPKHKYGSIIGLPISVGKNVYGVLNIQSENKNAFTNDDLVAIQFYADICALAHLYDTFIAEQVMERGYHDEI